jgi:hypothetical protein
MNRSIPIQQTAQIMSKLVTTLLSLSLILASGVTVAQVDTGGGMGGTGTRRESELIDPAGDNGSNSDCTKANSIGIVEVKNKNTQRILRREYACRGQMMESSSSEIIELHLRTGEKIIVLENSAIVVE